MTARATVPGLWAYVANHPAGFTVDPGTLAEPEPRGYAVSLPGHTHALDILTAPATDGMHALAYVLGDAIYAQPGVWLGGWAHDGQLVLEPSVIMADRSDALLLGRVLDQCSVWDLQAGRALITRGELC